MRKGSKYLTVDVDLAKWARAYLGNASHGAQSELARKLGLNPGRVNGLLNGKCNTFTYLETIVEKIYGGQAMEMAGYATSRAGLKALKRLELLRKMSPLDEDRYDRLFEKARKAIYEGQSEALEKAIDALQLRVIEGKM